MNHSVTRITRGPHKGDLRVRMEFIVTDQAETQLAHHFRTDEWLRKSRSSKTRGGPDIRPVGVKLIDAVREYIVWLVDAGKKSEKAKKAK